MENFVGRNLGRSLEPSAFGGGERDTTIKRWELLRLWYGRVVKRGLFWEYRSR
jgi:hypothetical protein